MSHVLHQNMPVLRIDLPCSMGAMGRFSHKKKNLVSNLDGKKKILLYVFDGNTIILPGSCSQLWSVINVMSCVLNTNSSRSQLSALSHAAGLPQVLSG